MWRFVVYSFIPLMLSLAFFTSQICWCVERWMVYDWWYQIWIEQTATVFNSVKKIEYISVWRVYHFQYKTCKWNASSHPNSPKYGFHSINSDNVLPTAYGIHNTIGKVNEREKQQQKKPLPIVECSHEEYTNQLNANNSPILRYLSNISTICRTTRHFFPPFVHCYRWAYSSHDDTIQTWTREHLYKGEIQWGTNPL